MTSLHQSNNVDNMTFGHAWRHIDGITGVVRFDWTTLHLHSVNEVRELITAALGAWQALARLEADPALKTVNHDEIDTAAIGAALDCAAACAVDGHVPPLTAAAPVGAPEDLGAAAAAARELLEGGPAAAQ